jgi:hypothetical protein
LEEPITGAVCLRQFYRSSQTHEGKSKNKKWKMWCHFYSIHTSKENSLKARVRDGESLCNKLGLPNNFQGPVQNKNLGTPCSQHWLKAFSFHSHSCLLTWMVSLFVLFRLFFHLLSNIALAQLQPPCIYVLALTGERVTSDSWEGREAATCKVYPEGVQRRKEVNSTWNPRFQALGSWDYIYWNKFKE